MNKIFFKEIFLTLIFTLTLFIGLNNVKADTVNFSRFYEDFSYLSSSYSTYQSNIEHLISIWEANYKSQYPYYYVMLHYGLSSQESSSCQENPLYCKINLYYSSEPYISKIDMNGTFMPSTVPFLCSNGTLNCGLNELNKHYLHITYDPVSNSYTDYNSSTLYNNIPYTFPAFIRSSSGVLKAITSNGYIYSSTTDYETLVLPSYNVSPYNFPSYEINNNSLLPDFYSLSGGSYDPSNSPSFTEINLNNYSYVILSLKDYTLRNEDNNQFSTPIYTLGSLCITPVYNYGMDEKKNYYSDYNVQACSPVYTSFSPVDMYILKNDLINHSVYYIKAYSSDTNVIKVDNTIFDITYITSSNEDNPSVIIGGRSYPTIPFSDLTQSANQSSENGYVSGQVCAIGDINCQANANGLDISELFSKPLELLETIWDSISTVFTLISSFISILPPTLQAFLYVSFMLIVVLGILRYIL